MNSKDLFKHWFESTSTPFKAPKSVTKPTVTAEEPPQSSSLSSFLGLEDGSAAVTGQAVKRRPPQGSFKPPLKIPRTTAATVKPGYSGDADSFTDVNDQGLHSPSSYYHQHRRNAQWLPSKTGSPYPTKSSSSFFGSLNDRPASPSPLGFEGLPERPTCPPCSPTRGPAARRQLFKPRDRNKLAALEVDETDRPDLDLDLTNYIDDRVEEELDQSCPGDSYHVVPGDSNVGQLVPCTPANVAAPPSCDPHLTIPQVTPGGSRAGGTLHLKPAAELPQPYRSVFTSFVYFNIIQSKAFDDLVHSNSTVVISAPTGSGKTVAFELAIVRELLLRDKERSSVLRKMIYLSPMKSLCGERFRDWSTKFSNLGVRCLELTGDSISTEGASIGRFDLVITTPEKWDVVTRQWKQHQGHVESVGLVMIDEVHLLNDENRGHTLEAIVSRMKTIEQSRRAKESGDRTNNQTSKQESIRFVAVSATIPNAEDVSEWLDPKSGVCYKFGEEKRPVPLRKIVLGYPHRYGHSEFRFEMNLSYRVAGLLATYAEGKPALVFCNSRRSAQFTASTIVKQASAQFQLTWAQKHRLQEAARSLTDHKLADCVLNGVGFHHAGLEPKDRRLLEELFVDGNLPVLASTSTLAMGVNLPAHLVVIKGTAHMISGSYKEYSESEVLQMIGRAGRPQFDSSATAIIMTTEQLKLRYENLVSGQQLIESSLHENLLEHLNAEVTLSTITDVSVALEWLKFTFFYVRVRKNPKHYKMKSEHQLEEKLQDLCVTNLNALAQVGVIEMSDTTAVLPTRAGSLMARFYIAFETMRNFSRLDGDEGLDAMLKVLCRSREFGEVVLRRGEKAELNSLNRNKHKATVRFPLEGKVSNSQMKTNLLMQAFLGCLHVTDPGLQREAAWAVQIGKRLARCLAQFLMSKGNSGGAGFSALKSAALLCKCLNCGVWNNSEYVSKQFERVGQTYSTSLVQAGFTTLQKLGEAEPRELEMILNKQPPFGNYIRKCAQHMPLYDLRIDLMSKGSIRITVSITNEETVREDSTAGRDHSCLLLVGTQAGNETKLKVRVRDSLILNNGNKYDQTVIIEREEESITVAWISEKFAGVDVVKQIHLLNGSSPTDRRPQHQRRVVALCSDAKTRHSDNLEGCCEENESFKYAPTPIPTSWNSESPASLSLKYEAGSNKQQQGETTTTQGPHRQSEVGKLSPAIMKALDEEWSPVSNYFGEQQNSPERLHPLQSDLSLSSSCQIPSVTITKKLTYQEMYRIEYQEHVAPVTSKSSRRESPPLPVVRLSDERDKNLVSSEHCFSRWNGQQMDHNDQNRPSEEKITSPTFATRQMKITDHFVSGRKKRDRPRDHRASSFNTWTGTERKSLPISENDCTFDCKRNANEYNEAFINSSHVDGAADLQEFEDSYDLVLAHEKMDDGKDYSSPVRDRRTSSLLHPANPQPHEEGDAARCFAEDYDKMFESRSTGSITSLNSLGQNRRCQHQSHNYHQDFDETHSTFYSERVEVDGRRRPNVEKQEEKCRGLLSQALSEFCQRHFRKFGEPERRQQELRVATTTARPSAPISPYPFRHVENSAKGPYDPGDIASYFSARKFKAGHKGNDASVNGKTCTSDDFY